MLQLFRSFILLFLPLFSYITKCAQLCNPYTAPYPCSSCQPYAKVTAGICNCLTGYFMDVTSQANQFCDLCQGTCSSCYGPLSTNCISCPAGFAFDSSTATCNQANSVTDSVIVQAYYIQGFTPLSLWAFNGFSTSTYQCGLRTLLGGLVNNPTNSIQVTLNNLPNHFIIRVKASFYFLSSNGVAKNAVVRIGSNSNSSSGSQTGYSFETCSNTAATYVTRAIDLNINHAGASAVLHFSTSSYVHYGIRDVIIITQNCASNCSSCDGYLPTQCKGCTDPKRLPNLVINGTCQCAYPYFQQPYAGTCADPCPSTPIKYYGDNSTTYCVANCPNNTFANDDVMQCWADCPVTSTITTKNLYRDYVNWKCVTNCPADQPYGDPVNRRCYNVCPSPRYGDNTTMTCVATCPNTYLDSGVYSTYASGRYCVAYCPSGLWADKATAKCITPCTSAAFPLMSNSTGQNLCVASCPPPNSFASSGSCITICPAGQYGDVTTWTCTGTCTSPYWGLQSYNRKCVLVCPSNTWARNTSRTCVNTTAQCNPNYANNFSRACVTALNCPFGTYADSSTWRCVVYCPNNSYGHPTTRLCQSSCGTPYFSDPGVNLCVTKCMTDGLFADVSSGRACVPGCNSTGATPWADSSTNQCVSDCNNTISLYLADNTTWSCVFECPLTHVADFTTTAPKCVTRCPSGWFADATPGTYKICVRKCSSNPPQFGDAAAGNLCVNVCTAGTFGDETGNRLCRATCPSPYFSQNDALRRCVRVCNSSSYGYQETCTYNAVTCQFNYSRVCYQDPHSCPPNFFGDNSTQLCVNPCPANLKTFGDPQSKFCVLLCPNNPNYTTGSTLPQTYYADISIRQCVLTCNSTFTTPLFGSNSTRTCQPVCLDFQAYAEPQSPNRVCIDRCLTTPTFFYANNLTKTCGTYMNCPTGYFGQNVTQMCVEKCPNTSWGFHNTSRKLCMDKCPVNFQGDDSTSKRICVSVCPVIPDRYADLVLRICVDMCNLTFYGDPTTRKCVNLCPAPNYFSFQPTRRCLTTCPFGYFADNTTNVRKCQPTSAQCTSGFGDPFLRACVPVCTGPTPVDTFGSGTDCVSFCPNGTYADSYSASRLCVQYCPPGTLNSIAAPNLYGDPTTRRCVSKCVTPFTWADRQTRLCQSTCSATPIPTYSQNFFMTCVTALNCPTTPTLTFGDNTTRSCVSFCSNNWWGDPTSRNCVSQCPNQTTTGTSNFYGDSSTGQYLCVVICPSLPVLFGQNTTNLCVGICPNLTYGDQTGNRTCVPQCPLINTTYYFAQNFSRICVTVCISGTWGLKSTRQCVQSPFSCGALFADNTTNLCVSVCPVSANLYGDPTTQTCVPICPNGSYADSLTQTCVTQCPYNNGVHSTFGNNATWVCQPICTQPNAYADLQTNNRYCVVNCSQSPNVSFADPSTKFCVAKCPTFPSLFGETQNFTCVSACVAPYFADTHTRMCVQNCDTTTQFKLRSPRQCVTLCPSSPSLFGDPNTGFCQTNCSVGFQYPMLRICVASCTNYSLFDYNNVCVQFCPFGYYADTNGHCVSQCPLATLFGQNTTTTCRTTCITGYAHNRLCVAICPDGLWGYNNVCHTSCPSGTASNTSNLCVGTCVSGTFNQNGVCVSNCTTLYADPNTHLCSSGCTLSRYADPSTHTCVQVCPAGSYRDPSFVCKTNCSPLRADDITGTCTSRCSNGTWGYNFVCVDQCPPNYFGYQVNRDCYNISNIPDSTLFADNVTQTWVQQCSLNPLRFGDRLSHQCVVNCSSSTQYSDPVSRQCEYFCTSSNYYIDPTTKLCVLVCPDGYHANPLSGACQINCTLNLFDYVPTHVCVSTCPLPYYGYQNGTQKICVLRCLGNTYAQGNLCETGCTLPNVADPSTNRCVTDCLNNTYASDDAIACISAAACSTYNTIADNSTNRCVGQCPTDPDYYEQNGICVPYCDAGTYADPTSGVRACTGLCTQGLYGDPVSRRCLPTCLPGYFAFNDTNLCLKTCPNGFADNQTGVCAAVCTSPTVADSLNNKCMYICSAGQFAQGNICVPTCNNGSFGNPITMKCQPGCPSFDFTFAQNTTHLCVKNCSIVPNSYADRFTNTCTDNCSLANQYALDGQGICTSLCPQGLFMENSTKKCQSGCDTGFAENTTRFCVARCFGNPQTFAHVGDRTCRYRCKTATQNLYADNQTNYCVTYSNCSRNLASFSDPISGNCVLFCPEGLYSQSTNFTCTSYCVNGFADNFTRNCVSQCPVSQETYGDPNSHTCVKVCPDGWFAENVTQLCVRYNNCPNDTWSDIKSKHCVGRCPSQPLTFGYDGLTSCVTRCPSSPDLFGDYVTQKCIWPCTNANGQIRFADSTSQTCVFVCPITLGLYGDPFTGRCTSSCNAANPFKDNSTQRCVDVCPSNPDYYAHNASSKCVRVCPTGLYASDPITRICTSTCQPWLTFKDPTTNRCVATCPSNYYADNSTYACVPHCPTGPDYYADPYSQNCVFVCPVGPLGANGLPIWSTWIQDINRTCVTRCPANYYVQNSSGRCVPQCPLNQYADPILQICVADCTVRPGYYKQTGSRMCVKVCPSTPVKAHRYEPTHVCVNMTGTVSGCIPPYFANEVTDYCTTICPSGYYADNYTRFCRLNCTNGQFADPVDRTCKTACTTNPKHYAYSVDMVCLPYCPSPFFSQNVTYTCTSSCPNTSLGVVLYAYNVTRQCVVYCPSPYYSYIDNQTCLLGCPDGWFAFDQTRTCQQSCAGDYSADDSTNRCVQTCPQNPNYYSLNNVCIPNCPNGTYKDNSTRSCVTECPFLPLTFADNSTNQCVYDCPSNPNYFADNDTRKCVFQCSVGFFADPSTRTCVQNCPDDLFTYAQPVSRVCQTGCPAPNYASDLTKQCVSICPNLPVKTYAQDAGRFCTTRCINGLFGNNETRKCEPDCLNMTDAFADITSNLCVTTCPVGFFAYNLTAQCRRDCPGLFSDSTTRKCVLQCPGTERLFADSTTGTCVSICPVGWYGDTDTWTCQSSCANVSSGYVLEDERLCVAQCPAPYFAFVSQRLCVQNCGAGLYGDQVSRTCMRCPSTCTTCLGIGSCLSCATNLYLQYGYCVTSCRLDQEVANYANNVSMTCGPASSCPSFTYGLNSSKNCETSCPTQMYADSTTKTCQNCPATCLTCSSQLECFSCVNLAQYSSQDSMCYAHCSLTLQFNYNGQCYSNCPDGSFADYTNVTCLACNAICLTCVGNSMNCTTCEGTFQYNGTCVTQCPSGYYGSASQCLICNSSVPSCSKPLTFTTTTISQNYQQVIILKFNQNTTIKSDPTKFINVNLKMTRRLIQDVTNLINNGVNFTSVVLPDGTIKLYLAPGVSLNNIQYSVSISDPTQIETASGATLQNLEQAITLTQSQVYTDTQTVNAPLVIVGKILAIFMLVFSFIMLIFGLMPFYLAIQATQMMSLFAYSYNMAPNLFYFLKQMRLSRFVFMPNLFSSVYVEPSGQVQAIPQKIVDTEGKFSFAMNGTSFIIFIFFYILMSVIVYLFVSKINSNRPLKNQFMRVWETRIKFSIINDFIWLFALNVLVQAFMQCRYPESGSDLALGIVWAVFMLALMFGLFGYGVKKYRENPESINDNYSLVFEGTKDEAKHKFFIFIYYLRKILFAVIITATVFDTLALAGTMLTLYSLVGLAILIVRPYKQHLHNFVILVNEGFLGFFCGGLIYFMYMIKNNQPSGAKITNGQILTIVTIVHICLLMVWGIYRSYFYLKQLYQQFKKSQFYKLYMDQQYDAVLQKQISQLNQEGKGQIQSIQVTNVADDKNGQQEDQIIRLKIKRRVKKQKIKSNVNIDSNIVQESKQQYKANNRQKGNYVKIEKQNQNYYKIKAKDEEYQKVIFDQKVDQQNQPYKNSPKQQSKQNEWIQMEKLQPNNIILPPGTHEAKEQEKISNVFEEHEEDIILQSNNKQQNVHHQYGQIINNNNDSIENLQERRREKHLEFDRKMKETFKSSFADFDEANYFKNQHQSGVQKGKAKNQQDEKLYKQQNKQELNKLERFQNDSEVYSQNFENQNEVADVVNKGKQRDIDQHSQLLVQNSEVDQRQTLNKHEPEYKVFNFDQMDIQEDNQQEQIKNQTLKQNQQKPSNKGWSVEVEDLLQEKNDEGEQEKQRKQKSKKMHLMLFEDDED